MEPFPEAKAADGGLSRSRGSSLLLPPGNRRRPKRQEGVEIGSCSGRQVNPLLAFLTFPVALTGMVLWNWRPRLWRSQMKVHPGGCLG